MQLPPEVDGRVWGFSARPPLHMHRHDELEVNLITRGTASYLMNERRYELQRGSLIWLFPEQDHVLLDQSSDYTMWILVFKPALVRRLCAYGTSRTLCARNPAGNFCRRVPPDVLRRLESLFEELSATDDIQRINAGLAYALLLAWAAHEEALQLAGRNVHASVETAARLLRDTSDQQFGLDALARQSGLSPARLSRLFKAQTGVSISAFRNRIRIERFLEIYGGGQRTTMDAAARQAGFGSYAQFHRAFRRVMGHGPARLRRSMPNDPSS